MIQMPSDDIENARTEIDQVDQELVRLLAERMQVVKRIAAFKGETADAELLDPGRERKLLARWKERARDTGISTHLAGRVLREILSHSRRSQESFLAPGDERTRTRVQRVAYQGEAWSYSDLAAAKLFETRSEGALEALGCLTFSDAIQELRSGRVDYAFLPVENSVMGIIGEVNSLLAETDLHVVDEETWEVHHVLAAKPGLELDRVRRVRSHPAALAQCGAFLSRLGVAAEPWRDTAGSAADVARSDEEGVAAICSEEAALEHGLVILRRGIADQESNVTRFLLLGREEELPPQGVPTKTSLLLSLDHQRGALARCLAAFAENSVNLTRIESRPQPRTPWQYMFFIDVEGHRLDARLGHALDDVRRDCNLLRILGSYPLRTKEDQHLSDIIPPPPAVAEIPATPKPIASSNGREPAVIPVGDVLVGGERFVLISGPCAVESREQIHQAARMVADVGAAMLRGGAFKPRTSPYSFQGLGAEGLELLREAGSAHGLPVVTEVMRIEDLELVAAAADVIQVGARNMQNFSLLRELGHVDRPVLLKRGLSATVKELLMAAEYIMAGGNQRVILCERGIRTFETSTRSTLDLAAVPVLKTLTHLPVIVDPSHAAGVRHLVVPLALAAAAVGADGLIVEAHPDPDSALCDKEQALRSEDLDELVRGLVPILASQGRRL
jgi:3-deoxy-7-phosphoheptulonate synthase